MSATDFVTFCLPYAKYGQECYHMKGRGLCTLGMECQHQVTKDQFDLARKTHYKTVASKPSEQPETGARYNEGKLRYDLITPLGLEMLAEVYTYGATKYADRNWEKGLSMTQCFASLMRHAWAWMQGQDYDYESNLHHMAHVAWNALAICHFHVDEREDLDDRP